MTSFHKWIGATLATLITAICVSPVQAEKIRWEDLPQRLDPQIEHRGIAVFTADGQKHSARRMQIEADSITLDYGKGKTEIFPSAEIKRIEIRQTGRFFHKIRESALVPIEAGQFGCALVNFDSVAECHPLVFGLGLTLTSPVWAYTTASAPFFLAADGIAFFVPPQTFDIVP